VPTTQPTPNPSLRRRACAAAIILSLAAIAVGLWLFITDAPYRKTAVPQPRTIQTPTSDITFLAWSDQHVTRDGDAAHLIPAIDAMNAIAGTPYPPSIGGLVSPPSFVIGCGDCTDWPTRSGINAFANATLRLRYISYNAIGNHDEGEDPSSSRLAAWIAARHGSTSYTFDAGPLRFIVLFSRDNAQQFITRDAMDYLRHQLTLAPSRPTVIVTHYCLDAIRNKDEFSDCLDTGHVLLVLGGHYHYAVASTYRNHQFLQVPSPGDRAQFIVIRLTPDRLQALTYDYTRHQWLDTPRTRIDLRLSSPP